jgi:hypothetical protein
VTEDDAFRELVGELLPCDTGFDSCPAVVEIDFQNLVQPGQIENNPPLLRDGRPVEMDAGTDRHHGNGALVGQFNDLPYF